MLKSAAEGGVLSLLVRRNRNAALLKKGAQLQSLSYWNNLQVAGLSGTATTGVASSSILHVDEEVRDEMSK